jgi:drug/metabolite transporter (DMT)-like permease
LAARGFLIAGRVAPIHAARLLMPNPVSNERTRALLMLVFTNFLWGLSFPLVKAILLLQAKLLPDTGTWLSTIYTVAPRFLLATLILAAWRPRDFWRMTRAELRQGVTIGLFAVAGMLLQNDGLHFTAASTSAFLTQVSAILIPVWLALRVRHNPGWLTWVCCVLVLAGVAILGRFDWRELRLGRGECETLLSSLFYMGVILTLDRKEFAGNRPEKITLVMFATLALVFWPLAAIAAPDTRALLVPWTSPAWLGFTAGLTIFCTVGAFSLMNAWQPKITATEAGLIYCVEPIFGSAMALVLPVWFSLWAGIDYANERATWTLLTGGALITLANLLLQLKPPVKN